MTNIPQPTTESIPIGTEIGLMETSPFHNECQDACREPAGEHADRGKADFRLQVAIAGVEMGRRMIVEIHPDDDPKES